MPYRHNNYSFVVDSTFEPMSLQELMTPFLMYKDAYEKQEAVLDELNKNTDTFKYLEQVAKDNPDSKAAQIYNSYANDLRRYGNDFSARGLSMANKRGLLNMKRRYQGEIGRLEKADALRKAQIKEQHDLGIKDPTLMFSREARLSNLDDYLEDPDLTYQSYSGALLAKQVGDAAANIAKSLSEYGKGKPLDGFTKTWLQQHGFTAGQVAQAINNPNAPGSSGILKSLVENAVNSSGITQWGDKATISRAYDYARQGLWNAVGQTQVQTYTDEAAKLAAQEASQKRVARYAAGLQEQQRMNGLAINPINIYNQKEKDQASSNMRKYAKYFTTDANGNVKMTQAGLEEYKRNVASRHTMVSGQRVGTGSTVDSGPMYQPSDFKKFIDSLGGGRYIINGKMQPGNLGNLWVKYNRDNASSAFDATKSTEFDYTISDSQQKDMKYAIQTAARGTKLQEVDFDRKTNTFKPSGDTIDMKDLNSDNVTILSTRFSPYGNTVMIKDKNGEVHRYNMPTGINPYNEANRDRAMQKAMQWQNTVASGQYKDAQGNVHQATPDEITYAQRMYAQALQEAYLYHSQLGVSNKTKEQEFNPYGY